MYLWVADKFAKKRKREKGNPGEEETVVMEGRGEKEKEIVRERERRGETAREREREKRGWRLKDENSVSPRKKTGQKQERLGEKMVCGVGVLQKRGVRERLGETRFKRQRCGDR